MKCASEIHAVLQGLARVEGILGWPAERLYVIVESVSGWSPAQQVEHILLSLDRMLDVIDGLESGEDERIREKGAPRLMARALLMTGHIPRGRANAPEMVHPDAIPSRATLREKHGEVRSAADARAESVRILPGIPGVIPHGFLGFFNAAQWLRFARIHTDHHLAIIDDIDRHPAVGEPLPDSLLPVGEQG